MENDAKLRTTQQSGLYLQMPRTELWMIQTGLHRRSPWDNVGQRGTTLVNVGQRGTTWDNVGQQNSNLKI